MKSIDSNIIYQLLNDEHIAWKGQPYSGLIFRPIDLFLIPFSLLWGGFAIFWNASVWAEGADLAFKIFGVPFIIAGLYMMFGRFLLDMILRKKLLYIVTNKRIMIKKNSGGSKTISLDISRLPALGFDERSDGSGTIRFGAAGGWLANNNLGIWQPTFDTTPQFIRIASVRQVYELIKKQPDREPPHNGHNH